MLKKKTTKTKLIINKYNLKLQKKKKLIKKI